LADEKTYFLEKSHGKVSFVKKNFLTV